MPKLSKIFIGVCAVVLVGSLFFFHHAETASVAFVQGNYAVPQAQVTSVSVSYNNDETAGDLNVVAIGWADTSSDITSVTDSAGNAYTLAVGPTRSTHESQSVYYAPNVAGGPDTITVHFNLPVSYADLRVLEYSGITPTNPIDVVQGNAGAGTTSDSGTFTTNSNDLIFAANDVSTFTSGPGAGFTSRMITNNDGDIAEDMVAPNPGTYDATASLSSGTWVMQVVAFHSEAQNVALTSITVTPADSILAPGTTQQFEAMGTYADGSSQDITQAVTWSSSDTAAATIDAQGVASAAGTSAATTTITAMLGSISGSTPLFVAAATGFTGATTWHYDNSHQGADINETTLTLSNVNKNTFGKLFSYPVDGQVYAEPLYVPNVAIPGKGTFNVLYVATQHDSVYAFDADGATSTPLWHVSFINPPIVTTVPAVDTGETEDITPEIGITGTPVIDPTTGTLYVVAKTKEAGGTTTYVQRLHALDITTGAEKFGGPAVIQPIVSGTGDGNNGAGMIPFDSLTQLQREALTLSNGIVYVAFSSHGDNPPYHGWMVGYDAATLKQAMVFNDTPDGSEGGIWQGAAGPSVDANGNIFIVIGNGTFDANTVGPDYGDSFIKLSPTGSVLDYFTPFNQATLSAEDHDNGSTVSLMLPDQPGAHPHLVVSGSKNGDLYVVDRDNMGKFNPNNDSQIVQELLGIFPNGIYTAGVYWDNLVYYGANGDVIKAFRLANGVLSGSPVMETTSTFAYPGAMLTVSSNGISNGILWAIERPSTSGAGVLHAYNANTLQELYNTSQTGTRDKLDAAIKFAPPTIANGKVYVSGASSVTALGLLPADTMPPSTPANLAATSTSSSRISLAWTASTDNIGILNYPVERCAGAGCVNFAQIGTAAGPSFADAGLQASTTYNYRVRASDFAGNLSGYSDTASATTQGTGPAPSSSPVFVQKASLVSSNSVTSIKVKFPANETTGDLNAVAIGWADTISSVASIMDSLGNAYTLAVGPTQSTHESQSIYYANNIAGGADTVTVTFNQAVPFPDLRILEYRGVDPANPIDVVGGASGSGTVSSSGPVTTTNADDLLFGANDVSTVTKAAGTGWTKRVITSIGGDIAEDRTTTSTGNYTATASMQSGTWVMQIVGFR